MSGLSLHVFIKSNLPLLLITLQREHDYWPQPVYHTKQFNAEQRYTHYAADDALHGVVTE
jgi:hypothetical protein